MIYAQHFSSEEFREWAEDMSPRLVTMLDVLRFVLGVGISISASPWALGRKLGPAKQSEHNVDHWPACLAVDCFVAGVYSEADARLVVDKAIALGFTGIGVYSDTTNNAGEAQVMFHFGVRPTQSMGQPATWGRVNKKYTSLETALESLK
jgi:hypothetical protein